MKTLLKASLATLMTATLISCAKGEEKKSEPAIYKPTQKTADDVEGLWMFRDKKDFETLNTEIPTPFAMEIDAALGLYIHQYDHQKQVISRNYLGALTIVGENRGEVMLDRPSYMSWLEPRFVAFCGRSEHCIKTQRIFAADFFRENNPSWDYDGAGASASPSYALRLRFKSPVNGGSFEAVKVSADQFAKQGAKAKEDSADLLGLAQRQLAKGPQGRLILKAKSVVYPLTATAETPIIPVDKDQTFDCPSSPTPAPLLPVSPVPVPVPKDFQMIEFQGDLQLLLNDGVSEILTFTKTGASSGNFAFWNPSRCGENSCSRVSIRISEAEVRLEETVDQCFKVISIFAKPPQ
ncbi:MAG: hypothetical protein AB7O96_17090 [Pseudobdellovibrionaceae bacterium]